MKALTINDSPSISEVLSFQIMCSSFPHIALARNLAYPRCNMDIATTVPTITPTKNKWITPCMWESRRLPRFCKARDLGLVFNPLMLISFRYNEEYHIEHVKTLPVADDWLTHVAVSPWRCTSPGICRCLNLARSGEMLTCDRHGQGRICSC